MSSKNRDFFDDRSRRGSSGGNEPRNPKRSGCGCSLLALMAFLCGVMSVVLVLVLLGSTNRGTRIKAKIADTLGLKTGVEIVEKEIIKEIPVEKIVEKVVEKQPPLPSKFVSWKKADTAELWNQIAVKSKVNAREGGVASSERVDPGSYEIELSINVNVPKPNDSVEDLAKLNSHLPQMLPSLGRMLESASVSPFYHLLYENKIRRIQENATRLDRVLSRHNFFDCETVLEITHPDSGQKALMIQGEMDVVTDGSDGDRWPELDNYISMSTHYQPFTSYAWKKTSDTPNPLLKQWSADLEKYETEFAIPGLSIERNRYLRDRIAELKTGVAEMKARSFLIAEADPFIVIPLSFLGRSEETKFAPRIGDMCAVIYDDKIYPAIAGDAGPTFKSGEASLRIAKELNENASPYSRPVSDLHVTYLIFPGTRKTPHSAPDLKRWHSEVQTLLDNLGGLGSGYNLHVWEDLIAKKKAEAEAEAEAEGGGESEEPGDSPADPAAGDATPAPREIEPLQ